MPETGFSLAVVTDHAVLRYLQRVHGLDVDFFRAEIASLCATGVRYGATAVTVEGAKFVLVGCKVVTTVDAGAFVDPFHDNRGGAS